MSDFDESAWMVQHAPLTCDEHEGGVREGWSNIRGCHGFDYLCGCFWGSDDGRGEGWTRHAGRDRREDQSDVVSDEVYTPVMVRVNLGYVDLYACDNYGNDPQSLTPQGARAVAAALIKAANQLEADDAR